MRICSIRQAHNELMAEGPGHRLTYHGLLALVESSERPSISTGKRFNMDLDWVREHLHRQISKSVKMGGRK